MSRVDFKAAAVFNSEEGTQRTQSPSHDCGSDSDEDTFLARAHQSSLLPPSGRSLEVQQGLTCEHVGAKQGEAVEWKVVFSPFLIYFLGQIKRL